jgi:hypothetical protein
MTPGTVLTCYVPDRELVAGQTYVLRLAERRDLKLPVMFYLEGYEQMFAPFRFIQK